ncbi:hypothetical protein F5884DRAFT_235297 [Xylogone sp. PMI_703]|nr:hypothetical protein F5884DRAFT_235297 [Xylogone sp. PMI_703]
MPINGKSKGRYELPVLTPVNFSLTDGTDIPPPPESPIKETAPALPKIETTEEPSTPIIEEHPVATPTNGTFNNRGRLGSVDGPLSPASSKRASSIRRFLSRKSLNSNYDDANSSSENLSAGGFQRPESAMSFASAKPSLTRKKSGSWFKRLGGNRSSVVFEDESFIEKKAPIQKGPPPPKLPELNQLKAKLDDNDEGSLGGEELFKNIK